MASFIIPSGILGLLAPRTIYADNGVQLAITRPQRNVKFGDGYKQILYTSKPKRNAQVTFSNREPEEINLIENYFIYLAGSSIDDLVILTQEWEGVVTSFNKMYNNGSVYGLSATITEK